MTPVFYNTHDATTGGHASTWDRRYLAPHVNHKYKFTGIPIDIIQFSPKRYQLIVASIYDCEQRGLEIDHVAMMIPAYQLLNFTLFKPTTFVATIHNYPTVEYIRAPDLKYPTPARIMNYTLSNPKYFKPDDEYVKQHLSLSKYLLNRIEMLTDQTEFNANYLTWLLKQQPNNGTRESVMVNYLNYLRNPVNRLSIHEKLKQ